MAALLLLGTACSSGHASPEPASSATVARSTGTVRVRPLAGSVELLPAPSPPSDQEIAAAIRDAFRADPRVPGATIALEVEDGVVTLRGAVSTLEQKRAAGDDARNARGASLVANRLQVRAGAANTPKDLEQRILARLRSHPAVTADWIDVEVDGGTVVLEGEVVSPFERKAAERAASAVLGVVNVDNRLRVSTVKRDVRDDAEIKTQIERALILDPRTRGSRLTLNVEQGIVSLRGEVANAEVYNVVLEKAFDALPRAVVNELSQPEAERFVYSD